MYEKVLLKNERMKNTLKVQGMCFGKIFLNNDSDGISLRNQFLSKITGKTIIKSYVINSTIFSSSNDILFTAICKTNNNSLIKIEIMFDDKYDKNKILAIYYTSRFIENCFTKNEYKQKEPELYQIRFTNYKIFDDCKTVHHFLYSDESDKKLKKVTKISFIELPKVKQLNCFYLRKR